MESEVGHALAFSTIIFGPKGTGVDVGVQEFNPEQQMANMIRNMTENQKEKLAAITTEALKRNWI